jgi:hypothetical protein
LCYKRRHTYAVGEPAETFDAEPELTAVLSGDRQ